MLLLSRGGPLPQHHPDKDAQQNVAALWQAGSSRSRVDVGAGGCGDRHGHGWSSLTRARDESQRASSNKAKVAIIGFAGGFSQGVT